MMALSKEGVVSALAFALAVVSIAWTIYIEKGRQRERREDIGYEIGKGYEDFDGSGLLEKLYEFSNGQTKHIKEDFIRERTIRAYNSGNLPDGFFFDNENQWLQSGRNYHMVIEPIDMKATAIVV